MTLESKLRALVAGMRYAADKCDEYATEAQSGDSRNIERARARTMRGDADALAAVLNEHEARDAR
jgi:hypothetical protein